MQRTTGTGFIAFGLVLVVAGAIMRYAVEASTDGFDMQSAGLIALWAGIGAIVIGLLLVIIGSRSHSSIHQDVVDTPTGQRRVEERDDFSV